ncbi:MAG: GNAT family N-acetyltransferase [Pseudomonadota bacterium]
MGSIPITRSSVMISVSIITINDDLDQLVLDINEAEWDEANDMSEYDVEALEAYLLAPDTVFVACYETTDHSEQLAGIASARFQIKPYDKARWLYVDEVDVCADMRQRGAGKAMMLMLIQLAEDEGCEDVWLGTEIDNFPANALYRSLDPDDIAEVVGYTFETAG